MVNFARGSFARGALPQGIIRKLTTAALAGTASLVLLAGTPALAADATGGAGRSKNVRAEIQELKDRIEELEETVDGHDERIGNRTIANAFDALKLDVGGFVDMAITGVVGEDNNEISFNRQVFELLVKARLWENWELFIAQAFIRASGIDFSDRRNPTFFDINSPVMTDTVLAWASYRASDALTVRVGRFLTPHGIINIEHFPAILLDPEQPQFLRPFSGQTIFPNFTDGVELTGAWHFGDDGSNVLKYHVYSGNFAGNATDFNYGARAAVTFGQYGVTLGLNAAGGERVRTASSDYQVYGADLLIDYGRLLWKNEIWVTEEDFGGDRFAFYSQPAIRITDQWTAFYRLDYLDNGAPGGTSWEHALGVTVKPNPNVHLRGIYTFKQLESGGGLPDADAHVFQLSSTFNF